MKKSHLKEFIFKITMHFLLITGGKLLDDSFRKLDQIFEITLQTVY